MATNTKRALIRKRQATTRLGGISDSMFYGLIREGLIKPGVSIGPRLKAWPEDEIQAYIDACIAARDAEESALNATGGPACQFDGLATELVRSVRRVRLPAVSREVPKSSALMPSRAQIAESASAQKRST